MSFMDFKKVELSADGNTATVQDASWKAVPANLISTDSALTGGGKVATLACAAGLGALVYHLVTKD